MSRLPRSQEHLKTAFAAEAASVILLDPTRHKQVFAAAYGTTADKLRNVEFAEGEGISGKVFQSGTSFIVNEGDPMPADSLRVGDLREANCFLSVPLKISSQDTGRERILGVFNLTRKRQSSMFTASDLKLVSAVAASAATQIHNCRLIDAEQRRRELEHELQLAARIQLSLLKMHLTCAEYVTKSIESEIFTIPDDYRRVSLGTMEQIINSLFTKD